MATGVLISDRIWHSENPIFYYQVEYEAERPDVNSPTVRVRFAVTMRTTQTSGFYYYPLYFKNTIDNVQRTIVENFGNDVGTGVQSYTYTSDWISFESTGTSLTVGITPMCGCTESHTSYDEGTITFDAYVEPQQYANFTEHYVSGTGLESITINWNADASVDWVQYSLNGGGWVDTSGLSYTIGGLSPNTQYSIKTKIRRTDSQLWTESGTIYGTTKDIARLVSYPNFNLGDSVTVTYNNPSGSDIQVGIYDLNGSVGYAPYRSCSGSSYTFNFTDTELDNIYKALGTANSGKFKVFISTAGAYIDAQEVVITLTGNQKTSHTNVSGTYKRAKRWVNVNGTWRRAVRWVNVNGTWRRCI